MGMFHSQNLTIKPTQGFVLFYKVATLREQNVSIVVDSRSPFNGPWINSPPLSQFTLATPVLPYPTNNYTTELPSSIRNVTYNTLYHILHKITQALTRHQHPLVGQRLGSKTVSEESAIYYTQEGAFKSTISALANG